MPRRITTDFTLDDCEDEIIYTRSALKADPDATDLLALTDAWFDLVASARKGDHAAREALGEANALRAVANARLDDACRTFGDALHLAVRKDHSAARYRRFFPRTVSAFVKQRLAAQVVAVRGWLGVDGEDLLEPHRPELERWASAAQESLDTTASSAQARGAAQIARETLAHDLTRERDALEAELSARAHERNLPRDFAARFFRVDSRRGSAGDATEPPATPPGSAPTPAG